MRARRQVQDGSDSARGPRLILMTPAQAATSGEAIDLRRARVPVASGIDAVVVQGWEADRPFRGRVATMALVPPVVDAVSPVRVVAAAATAYPASATARVSRSRQGQPASAGQLGAMPSLACARSAAATPSSMTGWRNCVVDRLADAAGETRGGDGGA